MKKILLKSLPEYFEPEKFGQKNWTIRKITDEPKFKFLLETPLDELELDIMNTLTQEIITRHPIHRCVWEGFVMLTWDQKEERSEETDRLTELDIIRRADQQERNFQKYVRKQLKEIKTELRKSSQK